MFLPFFALLFLLRPPTFLCTFVRFAAPHFFVHFCAFCGPPLFCALLCVLRPPTFLCTFVRFVAPQFLCTSVCFVAPRVIFSGGVWASGGVIEKIQIVELLNHLHIIDDFHVVDHFDVINHLDIIDDFHIIDEDDIVGIIAEIADSDFFAEVLALILNELWEGAFLVGTGRRRSGLAGGGFGELCIFEKLKLHITDGDGVLVFELAFVFDAVSIHPDTIHAAEIANEEGIINLNEGTMEAGDFRADIEHAIALRAAADEDHRAIDGNLFPGPKG